MGPWDRILLRAVFVAVLLALWLFGLGRPVLNRKRREFSWGFWGTRVSFLCLGSLGMLIPYGLAVLVLFINPSEVCWCEMAQLRSNLQYYTQQHNGEFPPLSACPGYLFFPWAQEMPDIEGPPQLLCPEDHTVQRGHSPCLPQTSYWYLGYAIESEDDMHAFEGLVRDYLWLGDPLPEDAAGLERLNTRIPVDRAGRIPLLIERPNPRSHHSCHVLFLDGGVKRIAPGEAWPLTRENLRILRDMDACWDPVRYGAWPPCQCPEKK